jgi:thiol-disulfide isomerase/thioredoxin
MNNRKKKVIHHKNHDETKKVTHEEKVVKKNSSCSNFNNQFVIFGAIILLIVGCFLTYYITNDNCNKVSENENIITTMAINEDTLYFLKAKMCIDKCNEIEPIVQDYAKKSKLSFKVINYPIDEIDVPGYFALKDNEMSLLSGIENKYFLASELCQFTNEEEICKEAAKLEAEFNFDDYMENPVVENNNVPNNMDLESLIEFNNCLAEKGFVIYGANWCGFCKELVTMLGGYDAVSSIYVECTENEALCQSEDIRGYPTIKINGQAYQGQRTISSFSTTTGCDMPN